MFMNFLIIFTLHLSNAIASLHSHFRHFEEILPQNIKIIHKRDLRSVLFKTKTVSFNLFGKNFQLELFPDTSILSHDFKVKLVGADGKNTNIQIKTDGIYSGHEKINPNNKVNAVSHEGLWYFYIWTPEDLVVLEPISRLDPQRAGNRLVAYKSRDVLTNSTSKGYNAPFCRVSSNKPSKRHVNEETSSTFQRNNKQNTLDKDIESSQRKFLANTRSAPSVRSDKDERKQLRHARMADDVLDTCDVFVVVDFSAYKGVGKQSPPAIVKWLISLFQGADHILRASGLSLNGVTYGVKLTGIAIHKEYTPVKDGEVHYNMANNDMSDTDTVKSFMHYPWHSKHCLAHLITERTFGGVLGAASIATTNRSDANGICMSNFKSSARNVGFSTSIDESGNPLTLDQHVTTLSHEIGHNFGAHHDPLEEGPCSPSTEDGGKYLMWAYTGSPLGPKRSKFSPCSLKELEGVMVAKAYTCFRSRKSIRKFCGDGLVSSEEDCDFGLTNETAKDKCCTAKCRFSSGAVCSQNNHPCCTQDCQVSPSTQVCTRDVRNACVKESLCDGVDAFTCPMPTPKPNGALCGDNGTCWQGECLEFCVNLGRLQTPPKQLKPCNCDENATMMCTFCCEDMGVREGRKCVPMGGSRTDGSSCLIGVCRKGVCESPPKQPLQAAKKEEEETDNSTAIAILFGVAGLFVLVAIVGSILVAKGMQSSQDDIAIAELRESVHVALADVNDLPESPADTNYAPSPRNELDLQKDELPELVDDDEPEYVINDTTSNKYTAVFEEV